MEFKEIQLQLVLLFHFGLQIAYGVPTLSASITPPIPVKGNNSHTVMCSYTIGNDETIQYVNLYRGTEMIITYYPVSNITAWPNTVNETLRQRIIKSGSLSTNVAGITYSNTLCSDEVSYKCDVNVVSAGSISLTVSNSTTVSIEAPPQTPVQMIVNPNFQSIKEFNTVTFTCSGNVGKPAGTFHWYMFTAANGVNPDNVTLQASTESPVPFSGDCTFTRRSSLTIPLLRKHTGLVVRCRVYHPTQVNNANPTNCTNPSAQFCQSSQSISVTYPVNVTVDSAIRQEVEGNIMILTCKPEANPEAWLEWFKSDSNVTLSNSPQLTFNRLSVADSGDYTCMGYNNISGVIYYASATVSVTVVPATLPPTTMRATTHSSPDSVVTGKQTTNEETSSAQCITPDSLLGQGIGIGVGVTLAFTIIVLSLVFIFWKWRHKQKPSGLNDPSINEDYSTRRSVGDGDYSFPDIHNNSYDSLRIQEMNLSSYYSVLNASNDRNNRTLNKLERLSAQGNSQDLGRNII